MKSRSITGAGGRAVVAVAGGAGIAGAAEAAAAAGAAVAGEREEAVFAATVAAAPGVVDGGAAGRTFCAAAARALAQLARLGASSLGAGVSGLAEVAVGVGLGGAAAAGLAAASPFVPGAVAGAGGGAGLRVASGLLLGRATPLAAASFVAAALSEAVF